MKVSLIFIHSISNSTKHPNLLLLFTPPPPRLTPPPPIPSLPAEIADPHTEDDASKYRPTRKVTQNPGGESHIKMFQGEYESEEALSLAPPKPGQGQGEGVTITHRERAEFSGVDVGDRGE